MLRARGVGALAAALAAAAPGLELFVEARATLRPIELLALVEAGARGFQFGLEALSTSLLRRMGKGTTALQSLEVLRTCAELGVAHGANLITHYPGATDEEIAETCANLRLARRYAPMEATRFQLYRESIAATFPEEHGLRALRPAERYLRGLPADLAARLPVRLLAYDEIPPVASWREVERCVREWAEEHARGGGERLIYHDGGTFLRVVRSRSGVALDQFTLEDDARELYLLCTRARPLRRVLARLGQTAEELLPFVAQLVDEGLMAREGDRLLSLAVASSPAHAARTIRAQAAQKDEDEA